MIAGQLIGLAASLATYLGGVWLLLRIQSRRIQALPDEWREHPDLRDRYDAAVDGGVRSVFTSPGRAGLGWIAGFIVTFAVLSAAEFTVGFELIFIAALALFWTIGAYQRNAGEVERLRREHGLPDPRPERWHGRWAAFFVVCAGFLGTACFAGGLLAAPLR
jgi:hypothetical protein